MDHTRDDIGEQVEYTRVHREETMSKEFGKMTL